MPSEEKKVNKPIKIDNKIEDDKTIENAKEVKSNENNKATTPETIEVKTNNPM